MWTQEGGSIVGADDVVGMPFTRDGRVTEVYYCKAVPELISEVNPKSHGAKV